MAQTSVRYLVRKLLGDDYINTMSDEELNILQEADEMHKEELHKCASFWRGKENEIEKPIFNEWYNETFKTKK